MQIRTFILGIVVLASTATTALAEAPKDPPFQPIWQLLNAEEKQQFIAGYLYGMRDAATMTNVLHDFLKANPNSTLDSLDQLQTLYGGLSEGKPDTMATSIDAFYKNPANREAPLSRAITAARGK